jgi:predicted RNA polymerase sigma factor
MSKTIPKWLTILNLYDALLSLNPSPVVLLNRLFALSKVKGAVVAIREAEKLNYKNNHFYYILLAELYRQLDLNKCLENFLIAMNLCKTDTEKQLITLQIQKLNKNRPQKKRFV